MPAIAKMHSISRWSLLFVLYNVIFTHQDCIHFDYEVVPCIRIERCLICLVGDNVIFSRLLWLEDYAWVEIVLGNIVYWRWRVSLWV